MERGRHLIRLRIILAALVFSAARANAVNFFKEAIKMRRFFLILLIGIISAILLFSVFKTNRVYAGTCSAPTQSQLLSMTTGTQVYNAVSCLSNKDLYSLLYPLSPGQTNSVLSLLSGKQLNSVLSILSPADLYGVLIPLSSGQLNGILSTLSPKQFYNLLHPLNSNQLYYLLNTLTSSQLYKLLNSLSKKELNKLLSKLTDVELYLLLSNLNSKQSLNLNWRNDLRYFLGEILNNIVQPNPQPARPKPKGPGGPGTTCKQNSSTGVYNCNINITITTQAPNEPSYSQSGGVSVTVANPQ